MLYKIFLACWYVFVALLLLVAAAVAVLRGYPSLYQHYLPAIQNNISSIIEKPVEVEKIRIDWYGYTPDITVKALSVYADDSKKDRILFAKNAKLSFDIYKSLLERKISIHKLTLNGSNLEAIRKKDGTILLNEMDITKYIVNENRSDIERNFRVSLLDSAISIKDEVRGLDYFFDQVNIVLNFSKQSFKLTSEILLPETLGNSFMLVADINDYDQGVQSIKGDLYTKGENINLELISDFFPQLQIGIKSGHSDFEVWGDFESLKKRTFKGSLAFRDLEYHAVSNPIVGIDNNKEITNLSTQFLVKSAKNNWNLFLSDSEIHAHGEIWDGDNYSVHCWDCDQENLLISSSLDYVDITHLMSTSQHFPVLAEYLQAWLKEAQISGVFKQTDVLTEWNDKKLAKYQYSSSIEDFSVNIPAKEVEISSLTGKLDGNHLNGELKINSSNLFLRVDKIFKNTLDNQNLSGLIRWHKLDDNVFAAFEDLSLQAEDMSASIQGSIQTQDQKIYTDAQILIHEAKLTALKKYMPFKKMRPKIAKWMSEAIQDGAMNNSKLLFLGDLRYPAHKGYLGAQEVEANLKEVILDYKKGWPLARELEGLLSVQGTQLSVIGSHGKILNSSIHDFVGGIDHLPLPRLALNGNGSGPAEDILDYLLQSSLLSKDSQIPKHISANGNVNLNLDMGITLTKKLKKERNFSGFVEFDNTSVNITSASLPFTELTGKLQFDRNGAKGQDLNAKLFGHSFSARANKLEGGRTLFAAAGDFDFDAYTDINMQVLGQYVNGITPIEVTVNVPRLGKEVKDKSVEVFVDTGLEGVSVGLPKPLKKEADEYKVFAINGKYQVGQAHPITASYDNKLFIQTIFNQIGTKVQAIELRVGDDRFNLPEEGLKVSGVFKDLDLNEWLNLSQPSARNNTLAVDEIDIQADSVVIANQNITDVDFKLDHDDQYWLAKIKSSIAAGELSYPLDVTSNLPAIGKFEYLKYKKADKELGIVIDPRKLPAFNVQVKKFNFNDYSFNDVALQTSNTENGMLIESLTGKGEELQINTHGVWDVGTDDIQSTNLNIALESQDLNATLAGFGYNDGVSKGEGRITGQFKWQGGPHQFSIDSFSGSANVRFKKGSIMAMEPGNTGRLIGLVNLDEITRRLSLDFTDFTSKGFVFDKIRGDLNFKDKNLTTENLSIKGPSADVLIQGRTGLVAKDYEQIVTVTPHVSGGLPWIGLIVGGPIGAGAVIVGEKVAKTIGINVDKVTEVKYSVTGSWDDPKIEAISKQIADEMSLKQAQSTETDSTPVRSPETEIEEDSSVSAP